MLWPDMLLAILNAGLILVGLSLLRRLARTMAEMDRLRADQKSMLVLFFELLGDLDRAARQDVARTTAADPGASDPAGGGSLRQAVEAAIALATEVRDPAQLARRTGVNLAVARAVIAFHGHSAAH